MWQQEQVNQGPQRARIYPSVQPDALLIFQEDMIDYPVILV